MKLASLLLFAQLATSGPPVLAAPRIATQAERPSVLIILADDVGWDALDDPDDAGPQVPIITELDGLAAAGLTLRQAYSGPVCAITRLAMMYGLYPRTQSVGWIELSPQAPGDDRLPLELVSLAELFKGHGYATGYTGKWHLGRAPLNNGATAGLTTSQLTAAQRALGPYCQGWDAWPAGVPSPLNGTYYSWNEVVNGNVVVQTQYATHRQRDQFIAWWSTTPGPKLGWLSFSAAHESGADPDGSGPLGGFDPPPGKSWLGTNRENYEQVVDELGHAIGAVLAQVSLANTFVVFTCDNGTPDNARPITTPDAPGYWKGTTYQGGVNVPLIIAGPGVVPGVSDRVVSLMDLGATLAEVAGIEIARGFGDSVSFADELGPGPAEWPWFGDPRRMLPNYGVEFVFTEGYKPDYDDQAIVETVTKYPGTQVDVRWKLRRVDSDGAGPLASADTVYELLTDPWETDGVPLSQVPVGVQNRLLAELASIPPRAP